MNVVLFLQQVDVAKKMETAPDSSYQIGVVIGSFIPFVILVGVAYWMYNRAKKRDQNGF
ncbi:hypothetical protein IUY40_06335 [Flavobacterium sp. ALJ2]|uniref:hypothetical protein n=1 Tax=Flavobacterium sp. ALJ2 TaxID=2786960 RepID=UPI0018A05B56|nr:hypothetical protein [Flavobacterium sp. ALJ2]MBF7091152.1 hypothetical protein [Flavobacterium sp. ALJ2]